MMIPMRISTRLQASLLTAVVLALAVPAQAGEVSKYLPNDTDVVVVINAKQILESPLFQKHWLEEAKTALKDQGELTKRLGLLGFDPLKDVTSVTIGGSIAHLDSKALIIVNGNFDIAKFERQAEEFAKENPNQVKLHAEGSHKVYEIKQAGAGDKPMFAALADKSTMLASADKQSVLDALGKATANKADIKQDLRELLEKADAGQSVWLGVAGSSLAKSDIGSDEDKKMVEKLENFTGSVMVSRDLKIVLDFEAKSPKAANELLEDVKQRFEQVKGMVAFLASNNKQLAPAADFLDAFKIEASGKHVTIKATASEDAIEKALKKK
jgi:hypothetical protein